MAGKTPICEGDSRFTSAKIAKLVDKWLSVAFTWTVGKEYSQLLTVDRDDTHAEAIDHFLKFYGINGQMTKLQIVAILVVCHKDGMFTVVTLNSKESLDPPLNGPYCAAINCFSYKDGMLLYVNSAYPHVDSELSEYIGNAITKKLEQRCSTITFIPYVQPTPPTSDFCGFTSGTNSFIPFDQPSPTTSGFCDSTSNGVRKAPD